MQGQAQARVKDQGPVRVTDPATEQATKELVPVMGQALDQVVRVIMRVNYLAMAPIMMVKAMKTGQVVWIGSNERLVLYGLR